MRRELSIYLDAIRFSAALVVLLSHLSGTRFTGGLLWQAGPYGEEAVDVFFVLSGLVIAQVCARSETTWRDYAGARLARVYSVALPALAATVALDALGAGVAWQVATSAAFLNQIWWLDLRPGSDIVYWSLSYEVWYYIIFGCLLFAPGSWRAPATAAAVLVAGPNIVALLPLWLLGVGGFYAGRLRLRRGVGMALCLGAPLLWLGYEAWAWHGHRLVGIDLGGAVSRNQIVQDYLVGGLFALHIIGFSAVAPLFAPALLPLGRPIRWAAGATFTIYLFHVPVAQFLTVLIPWPPAWWGTRLLMLPGMILVLFAIAEVTERRKAWWRRLFAAALAAPVTPRRA
jgi:peptidoglycan/LPS O-acetylase OafA/YrhL